jgi:hypothetical protein
MTRAVEGVGEGEVIVVGHVAEEGGVVEASKSTRLVPSRSETSGELCFSLAHFCARWVGEKCQVYVRSSFLVW